ncbi:hypothetical protein VCB98_00880 [Gammaproteobacteria bacterium AB-CW1]|uniref:Protochlamydia outer membrane protein domain-containing protein n=1 Tax=Natronospira elongata TaxID=3110268 RepID=A0AAP6MLS4_9GAMM|nr:hypothetical protein [Gammaproteobacteria bacterium AB-CW1]
MKKTNCLAALGGCLACLFALDSLASTRNIPTTHSGMGFRQVNWENHEREWVDGLEFDDNNHYLLDFSIRAGDNFYASLLLDLDDSEDSNRRIAGYLGFGDWGLFMDRGQISGSYGPSADLDISPEAERFQEDYEFFALYRWEHRRDGGRVGLGYGNWTLPTEGRFNVDVPGGVSFIDTATEFEVLGIYIDYDWMRAVATGYRNPGFGSDLTTFLGYQTLNNRGVNEDALRAATGTDPITEERRGLGGYTRVALGYYGLMDVNDSLRMTFSLGYQVQLMGFLLGEFDNTYRRDDVATSESGSVWNHGFFFNLRANW